MVKVDRLLLCDCAGSMKIDADTANAAVGADKVKTCSELCMGDIDVAAAELAQDGTTLIACGQQASLFRDLMAEIEAPGHLLAADIRDRAGWTADANAFAKQSALLAEAVLNRPNTPLRDVHSEGLCLILGDADDVIPAAKRLSDTLSVTCLLNETPSDAVPTDDYDISVGHLKSASGAFTTFELTVDGYAPLNPTGRGGSKPTPATDGMKTQCDIILDMRGGDALFPAPEKRDGYLRADPRNPTSVERAIADAKDLIGTFEKPLYIRFDASICAHSRASQAGCNRCLDVCPTGAILSAGDSVEINPDICAGCGACASVCPSGAASFDDPGAEFIFARLRALASAYTKAGGTAPRVLFHDETFGTELIQMSSRFGKGLPADTIPFAVSNVESIGHAEVVAALGVGFAAASILISPKTDRDVIDQQMMLASAIVEAAGHGTERITIVDVADPDAFEEQLYGATCTAIDIEPILPLGGRRDVTRLATNALVGDGQPIIELPKGAPYGSLDINTDACTLCLACVSLCPVGALGDNPDKPELRFQETACLQCGICENTCPENAITLQPRINLENEALAHRTLHEEEPFDCITCGKPFGVRSTIERITESLKDKHPMFTNSDNFKLIQMCDDCRVNAQFHQEDSPFKSADRPRVRTTQDYLDEREN